VTSPPVPFLYTLLLVSRYALSLAAPAPPTNNVVWDPTTYTFPPDKPRQLIDDLIATRIDRNRSKIAQYLQKEVCPYQRYEVSAGDFGQDIAEHINSLNIPMTRGVPNLLLHGIGTDIYHQSSRRGRVGGLLSSVLR
jgi:hypothetical protein